ncbi:MAG: hypothetical protein FWE33_01320 [Defluviitaleaceae bacterium]|nr:hypothetical protein [Defluviitaleaceae bacterium]
MLRYSIKAIDDLGKIQLQINLRRMLDLEVGDTITLLSMGGIVILQKLEEDKPNISQQLAPHKIIKSTIGPAGRFVLSKGLRDEMGWKVAENRLGERICVYYVDDSMLVLSRLQYRDKDLW